MLRKEKTLAAKFVLKQDGQNKYLITFQTHSGQVLLTIQVGTDKDSALRRISATRNLAQNEKNFELHTAEDGSFYFVIKNAKGEVLAQSDMFPDPESMRNRIELTKMNSRGARLEDLTGNL